MRLIFLLILAALPVRGLAEAPKVVASIKPVFDLVRVVMAGVGVPDLLLTSNESVHHTTLRPSRMRLLSEADLVVLVGGHMEPWLENAVAALAGRSEILTLANVEGVHVLDIRQPATLASDEEQELAASEMPEEPQPEKDSDFFVDEPNFLEKDLEDQAAADAAAADAENLAELAGDGPAGDESILDDHAPGPDTDPHVWLDPKNSALFLTAAAEALSRVDPENAETYRTNAESARQHLSEAVLQVKDRLVDLTDTRFIYNHDSFQYFEKAFGLKSLGSLNTSDGKQVGARTISGITSKLEFAPVICIVIDGSESARSANALFSDLDTVTLDPMGLALEAQESYPASLFLNLAEGFAECD